MDKGDDGAADDAARRRRQEAHDQDENRKEAAEFVLTQCKEGHHGSAGVDKDGREEGPQENVVPHLAEGVQPCLRAQTHYVGDGVQLIGVVGIVKKHDCGLVFLVDGYRYVITLLVIAFPLLWVGLLHRSVEFPPRPHLPELHPFRHQCSVILGPCYNIVAIIIWFLIAPQSIKRCSETVVLGALQP